MIRRIRPPRADDPIYLMDQSPRLASSAACILVQIVVAVALVLCLTKIFDYFDPPEGVTVHAAQSDGQP